MRKPILSFASILICFFMLIASFGAMPVMAEETEDTESKAVTVTFTTMEHTATWDFPYSDAFFRLPSDQYDHEFARLSLGMALAAFRDADHPEKQDDRLIKFFEDAGFGEIETDTYGKDPEADSIAYGLALKKIGDITVLACAVCGGNYSKEWASNLTVGDEERSEGFNEASLKVQAAVRDYVERHPETGPVKLWISGFSRAAAVSNITAADLTEAGIFDDVYAYTFATPVTTRKPIAYPNIFNILQKDDVVPKVPLTDWGYRHFGNDLLFVSRETDSDSDAVLKQASLQYQKMLGSEMVFNSEIDYQLRILMDYLLMLMPEAGSYEKYLQPVIIDIMTKSDETKDALLVLLEALERYSVNTEQNGEELKALREYLGTIINVYYLQGRINKMPPAMWDPGFNTGNLFNAHYPFEYLSLMYASDDPDELFSDKTNYIRLVIYGIVDADIIDGEKVIKTVLADGTELVDGKEAPYSFPDVDWYEEKVVITLPADRSYQVKVQSRSALPQTVSYTGLLFTGNTVKAQSDDFYSFLMSDNETAIITTSIDGRAIEPDASYHTDVSPVLESIYSPTTAMRLENNTVLHLTISGLVNKLLFIIVFLFLQMIASIILAVIRKKKKRKRNMLAAFIWHFVVGGIFAIIQAVMWYFVPIFPLARLIPAVLVFIVYLVYALKGYRYHKKGLKTFYILTGAIVLYYILSSMLIGEFTFNKALAELIAYIVYMVLAYLLLWKRKWAKDDMPAEKIVPEQ